MKGRIRWDGVDNEISKEKKKRRERKKAAATRRKDRVLPRPFGESCRPCNCYFYTIYRSSYILPPVYSCQCQPTLRKPIYILANLNACFPAQCNQKKIVRHCYTPRQDTLHCLCLAFFDNLQTSCFNPVLNIPASFAITHSSPSP
jgi:hypothetical protein